MTTTKLDCTFHPLRVTPDEYRFISELSEAFQVPVSQLLRANLMRLKHSPDPIRSLAAFL